MVVEGALVPWAAGIAGRLESLGYRPTTIVHQLRLVGKLSRFLHQRGLAASELTGEVVEEFVGDLRGRGSSKPTAKSLVWLVELCVEIGVATETSLPTPRTEQEELVDRYRRYLVDE
jgi:integrase/recombinase XerD